MVIDDFIFYCVTTHTLDKRSAKYTHLDLKVEFSTCNLQNEPAQ